MKNFTFILILIISCFCKAYSQQEGFPMKKLNSIHTLSTHSQSIPHALSEKVKNQLASLNKKNFIALSQNQFLKKETFLIFKENPQLLTVSNTRIGGYALYDPNYSIKTPNVFACNLQYPQNKEIYNSPMNPYDTWGLYGEGITMQVTAGAWIGKEWVVSTVVKFKNDQYLGHWFTFEPLSGKVKFIGSGNMSSGYGCLDFAYDYTQNKLYGVSSVNTKSELRLVSTIDTTQTTIGIIKLNANDTLKDPILALACSNEGTIYGISLGGNLYKINKTNALATLIGNLNTSEQTGAFIQSATFDRKTNKLYYQQSANHENLLCIDTLTGKASTLISGFAETSGLFHHYYENEIPPSNPTYVSMKTDINNVQKINLSWTNPSTNFNGDSLKNLAKIYIYRGTELNNMSKFDSVPTTVAGDKLTYSYTEKTQGVYYYGIEAITSENIASANIQVGKLSCVQLIIPYINDFESPDRIEESCTGDWKKDTSGTHAYQGKAAYIWRNGYTGEIQINELPMEKNEVYLLRFYAKGKPQYGSTISPKLLVGIKKDSTLMQTPISLTTNYVKYDVVYKSNSSERVQQFFTFDGTLSPQNYIFSIDTISTVLASQYPDSVTEFKVVSNPQGELSAEVSWKNPTINLKGTELKNLEKITIQYAEKESFANYLEEEVSTNQIGKLTSKILTFKKSGIWYFRTLTTSSIGECPYFSSTYKIWVGFDSVLGAPSNFRSEVFSTNGTTSLYWDTLKDIGENGGYLYGSNTGYRVIRNTLGNKKPDTTFIGLNPSYQSQPLNLDLYTFEVRGIRNQKFVGKPASAYSLVGLSPTHYLAKNSTVNRKSSYSYPFYVTYSTSSKSSAFSQFIYTSTEMGSSKLIDTLIFVKEPASGNSKKIVKQRMLIYMGYKKDSTFANVSDWVSLSEQTLVYDDTVLFDTLTNTMNLAIKPFLYEKGRNLLFSMVKPMQGGIGQGIYPYVGQKPDDIYHIHSATDANPKPTETDFINVTTTPVGPGVKASVVPILVLNQMQHLATVKGKVSRLITLEAIPEFKLTITSKNPGFYAFNYNFNTINNDGDFEFPYLPEGEYKLRFESNGYIDSVLHLKINASETVTVNILLNDAHKIKLSGKVVSPDLKPLEGVEISLNDYDQSKMLTNALGEFSLNIYGSTNYILNFSKKNMQSINFPCIFGASDTTLENIILNYQALPVPVVKTQINSQAMAEITWEKPNGRTKTQWCKDIEIPKDEHLIGTSSFGTFKAAVYFAPGDLKNLKVINKKLYQVRFYSADSTAKYTIRIYQGEKANEEIYFQRIDKMLFGWNNITLTDMVSFDTTKNLWVAIEVAGGYKGSPLSLDNGPKTNSKSAWAFLNEKWAELSSFMIMDANWNLMAFFRDSNEIDAANGYRVYRGNESESIDKFSLLTQNPIHTLSYIDTNYNTLNYGKYKYAIKSDWFDNNLSDPTYSNTIIKDLFFKVNFIVNTDGASAKGAKIKLSKTNSDLIHYQGVANKEGYVEFNEKIDRGNYNLMLILPNHPTFIMENIEIRKDTLWNLPILQELISNPYILTPQINNQTATLEWCMGPSFIDDMEDYFDFEIDQIGVFEMPYKTNKGWIQDVSWENKEKAQSFIVFNPNETNPSMKKTWTAHSGEKMLAAFCSAKAPNQDWLIRPIFKGGGELSFYAFGVGIKQDLEKFKVLYSKTTTDTASFISLSSEKYLEAPNNWKEYKFQIPTDAKYIAINYISNNLFALLIDDLTFKHSSNVLPQKIYNPIGYQIYLDGLKVADTNVNTSSYTFEDLSEGTHQLGIKAVFASGTSELITQKINIKDVGNEANAPWFENFKVYPNPSSSGEYILSLPNTNEVYEISILQAGGKIIFHKQLVGGSNTINLSTFSSGVYFMHIKSKNFHQVIKLVQTI